MSKLKRTYASLGRFSYKAVTPFLKRYLNDKHVRVRVLIVNEDKEVLLVKSWLGHQRWSLPGGGIKRGETPAQSGAREVLEETGLRMPADHLKELGVFPNEDPKGNYTYTVACFVVEMAKREPRVKKYRKLEMLDTAWFSINELPKDISKTVTTALELRKNA